MNDEYKYPFWKRPISSQYDFYSREKFSINFRMNIFYIKLGYIRKLQTITMNILQIATSDKLNDYAYIVYAIFPYHFKNN